MKKLEDLKYKNIKIKCCAFCQTSINTMFGFVCRHPKVKNGNSINANGFGICILYKNRIK